MKKNASGFTLIELLAVIVVLAIVILMASMAIIPRMNEARKQVFSMESNEAINAASSYWLDGAINGGDTLPIGTNIKCIDIKTLREKGDFKNDSKYNGYVMVKKESETSNNYLYVITMTNENLMVVNAGNGSDVKPADVKDYSTASGSGYSATCPTTPSWPTKSGN